MTDETALARALRRLDQAFVSLERAAARLRAAEESREARDNELALLADDRTRLAEELDALTSRASQLEHVNRDVARRLDGAMETIRTILAEEVGPPARSESWPK